MKSFRLGIFALCALSTTSLYAQQLQISIGVRETGGSGPAFSNGGTANGIEFVNLDGQNFTADGTWQLFTFTPSTDSLTAFAGATANGVLDVDWGTLEHIRVRNSQGITAPIRMWVDDVTNTDSGGSTSEGFESFNVGDEVMFQEPSFSGSTAGNLLPGSTSAVSDSMAFAGNQSYEMNFQFVDGDPTRWVRLTSFGLVNLPNVAMHLNEMTGAPTISFYAKAVLVPEPSTLLLAGVGALGFGLMIARRRRG